MKEIYKTAREINDILKKYNIKVVEVSDYALYPIADNDMPQLSSDRLEYIIYIQGQL